jgi:hypothetical protein
VQIVCLLPFLLLRQFIYQHCLPTELVSLKEMEDQKLKIQADYLALQGEIERLKSREEQRKNLRGEIERMSNFVVHQQQHPGLLDNSFSPDVSEQELFNIAQQIRELESHNAHLERELELQRREKSKAEDLVQRNKEVSLLRVCGGLMLMSLNECVDPIFTGAEGRKRKGKEERA